MRVRVEPKGYEFEVADREPVMAAAQRAGYQWPTICGGEASCGACVLTVPDETNCSPMQPAELAMIEALGPPAVDRGIRRLACQLRVTGDVVVTKRGVRPAEVGVAS
jgi:ferredoxin